MQLSFREVYIPTFGVPREFFHAFFVVCYYFQNQISNKYFRNTIKVSNSLDPGQARYFVGPGLGPNCLQNVISRRHLEAKSKAFYVFVIADIRQTSVSQHIKLIH